MQGHVSAQRGITFAAVTAVPIYRSAWARPDVHDSTQAHQAQQSLATRARRATVVRAATTPLVIEVPLGELDMIKVRIPPTGALMLFVVAFHLGPIGNMWAQVPGAAGHEHLTGVACLDVRPPEKRPEFGCFNIGTVTGLHFSQASVYCHLRTFPSPKAAEAAKSPTGIVVEEDGRV